MYYTKPTWIIEETKFCNDFNNAQKAMYILQEMGCPIYSFSYAPFGATNFSFLRKVDSNFPVVFYGSVGGLNSSREYLAEEVIDLKPYAWYDKESFACKTYYGGLKDFILQQNHKFISLEDLSRKNTIDEIYGMYGRAGCIFIRPDSQEKEFTGQIVKYEDFSIFKNLAENYRGVDKDILCVVAEPVKIYKEWRTIVVDGKAVSGSQYKDGVCLFITEDCPKEVLDFAEKAFEAWHPYPVMIIDVAFANKLYVIEIGCFSFAGLYRSDLFSVIDSINQFFTKVRNER